MRNPEETRRRLLEAASAEFAAYGIAGARVERIAEASACNKQSIYGHFGSKEGLFDAVFDSMVRNVIDNIPFDAHDLTGYASSIFDWFRANPQVLRLATWHQLERGGVAAIGAAAEVGVEKLAKIRAAQAQGVVTKAIPAQHLLLLIYRLITVQLEQAAPISGADADHMRASLMEAVKRLVSP